MTAGSVWFADPDLVGQLPFLFRLYALYSRLMFFPAHARVFGGSFLLRLLGRLIAFAGLPDEIPLRVGECIIYLDLCDARMPMVIHEVRDFDVDLGILRNVLQPGDTFLDVGANHGTYSIVASKLVGPDGAVVAVEAIPKLARLIEKSLAANRVRNFEVHTVAAGDASGAGTLFVPMKGSESSSIYPSYWAGQKRLRIPVTLARLDDVLAWERYPGRIVMKLDVEGSELACLRGARRLIEAKRPVILLEINPTSAAAAGQEPDAVLRHLAGLGYDRVGEVTQFPNTIPIERVDCSTQRNVLVHPCAIQAAKTRS
ncbi:MAG: hypothetical protein DMF80_12595 [Acidobacteria bacterium]|nr:MAG: hypothetical protein DMF80_12595 [Acidobacteriota bacterium]